MSVSKEPVQSDSRLQKNVFLWSCRSWIRKGFEAYFVFLIETFWSNERIMEVYLNVIEIGDGVYGAQTASTQFFKSCVMFLSKIPKIHTDKLITRIIR